MDALGLTRLDELTGGPQQKSGGYLWARAAIAGQLDPIHDPTDQNFVQVAATAIVGHAHTWGHWTGAHQAAMRALDPQHADPLGKLVALWRDIHEHNHIVVDNDAEADYNTAINALRNAHVSVFHHPCTSTVDDYRRGRVARFDAGDVTLSHYLHAAGGLRVAKRPQASARALFDAAHDIPLRLNYVAGALCDHPRATTLLPVVPVPALRAAVHSPDNRSTDSFRAQLAGLHDDTFTVIVGLWPTWDHTWGELVRTAYQVAGRRRR